MGAVQATQICEITSGLLASGTLKGLQTIACQLLLHYFGQFELNTRRGYEVTNVVFSISAYNFILQ